MSRFGDFIKQKRIELGLSLRDMESRTGISNAYLSMIESGKRPAPHPNKLKEIAIVLGIDLVELMKIAGYLDQSKKEEEELEINLQYKKAINDPEFSFGHRMKGEIDLDTKRFIVEMYRKLKHEKDTK